MTEIMPVPRNSHITVLRPPSILAAFIASIVLLPLLVYFTKQLRLEYIPRLDDYLISFIIFSAIMLISTLPGLKRTVRNPLRKRGG